VTTLFEYEAKMHAFELRKVDKEHDMHKQAWLNEVVSQTKKQGKKQVPMYKSFKDFYDYEKRLKEVSRNDDNNKQEIQRLANIAKNVNERR